MTAPVLMLLKGVAATSGDKTVVDIGNNTPFLPGREAILHIDAQGQTGSAPAWALDTSEDNSTFTADVVTSVVAAGHEAIRFKLARYLRPSVTTAAGSTAGTLSMWLEAL